MNNREIHLSNLMKLYKGLLAAGLVVNEDFTDQELVHKFNKLLELQSS